MATKNLMKEVSVGRRKISLFLQDQAPIVEVDHQRFLNVWLLVDEVKELAQLDFVKEFAEISNFFWKGNQFKIVESIPAYQRHYREQVELEKRQPADLFAYRLTDFKIFDVSMMHDPRVVGGQLSYFVYHSETHLPYRVQCPFPYTPTSTRVHYQILPLL